jgi:hypothetical protein
MGMADSGSILLQRITALCEIADRIPGGIVGLTAAQDDDVVDLLESAQQVTLSAQGILAAAAGELARRSSGSGDASLARRLGWKSAQGVIAAKAGLSFGEASRAVNVGEAIRPRVATSGEDLPADRPHIAAGVLAGELPLSIARLIDETIGKIAWHLLGDDVDTLERGLVAQFLTGEYSVATFTAHCHEIIEQFDPVGAGARDKALQKKASIRETWLPDGMLRIVAELDPERAAFYRAALRARTNPRRQAKDGDGGSSSAKQAGPMESKLDAFTSIMRDSIKSDGGKQAGVDTTILVRIDLQALLSGIGSATIDGIGKPVSAATARRLAVEADIIPQVLGGTSQVLDQGESKRIFTKAQRYAILAAFIGCAFPKCDIPSSMVEFHHIGRWASRHDHHSGTDLQNGIPLCGFHNRLMEEGWDIRFDDDRVPWFTPPATVDWAQRPIRGGNLARKRAA